MRYLNLRYFACLAAACALLTGQNAEELLTNGIEQLQKGQYAAARENFEKTLALSPADARALAYLAVTRASLGECGNNLGELRHQFERNRDPELRKLTGIAIIDCLLPRNDFAQILGTLGELEQRYPADPDVLYEAARVHRLGWAQSMARLMRTAPDSWRAHQLSAEVHENQGRWKEAASEYGKALAQNPSALRLHYQLGMVLRHDADLEPARKEFEAELVLNPADLAAEYYLGDIDLAQEKPAAAAAHFEKALQRQPQFAEALVGLGRAQLALQQTAEAIQSLERAVQLQPEMQAAHHHLMLAYRAAGKTKQAQKEEELSQKPPSK